MCAEIGDPTAYPWVGKPPHFTLDSQVTSWKQLSEWERLGGRTLQWAISTACQQHYQLDVLMARAVKIWVPLFVCVRVCYPLPV